MYWEMRCLWWCIHVHMYIMHEYQNAYKAYLHMLRCTYISICVVCVFLYINESIYVYSHKSKSFWCVHLYAFYTHACTHTQAKTLRLGREFTDEIRYVSHTYLHTHIHSYIHTYMHAYIHVCIYAYIYIYAYIHT